MKLTGKFISERSAEDVHDFKGEWSGDRIYNIYAWGIAKWISAWIKYRQHQKWKYTHWPSRKSIQIGVLNFGRCLFVMLGVSFWINYGESIIIYLIEIESNTSFSYFVICFFHELEISMYNPSLFSFSHMYFESWNSLFRTWKYLDLIEEYENCRQKDSK